MTVTVKVDVIKQLEEQIESLTYQLNSLKPKVEGFESLDSDRCLLEVYNS
jgi:hypothetical protein